MNSLFWFLVGLLTGVTAAAVAMPLWRASRQLVLRPSVRWALVGGGVTAFAATAVALYLLLGSPGHINKAAQTAAQTPGTTGMPAPAGKVLSMEAATSQLAERLERQGGNDKDWQLLAQAYDFVGRTEDAQRARSHVSAALPPADVPGDAAISGTVTVDSSLAAEVGRGATLFVYAKAVDSPGPPLAVMRVTAEKWPVAFRLDDAMAMIPSRRLSQFVKVVVEARISRTGQAAPAPGDLDATSEVLTPRTAKPLALVINHRIG